MSNSLIKALVTDYEMVKSYSIQQAQFHSFRFFSSKPGRTPVSHVFLAFCVKRKLEEDLSVHTPFQLHEKCNYCRGMNKQPYVLRFIMQHGKFPTKNNEEYQIRNPRQNLIHLWCGICFTTLCLSTNFVILSY